MTAKLAFPANFQRKKPAARSRAGSTNSRLRGRIGATLQSRLRGEKSRRTAPAVRWRGQAAPVTFPS